MITLHTSHGDITIELDFEKAPKTAENFQKYAQDGFYDGTIFHRVINNFMVQGGGFTEDMQQKETRAAIENEADNGLLNNAGSLAMARTADPHSASAQFFINVKDNDFLNHKSKDSQGWGYCVFGRVSEGMDVVNKIKEVETGNRSGHQDVPTTPIVIQKVSVAAA
ncbi:MAG: peptidyl-prolyl cis-trans isomerase [Cellvibrionaceae bacterium]|nr:peptidyl-prolyl cis-trans isomerase [Cellvibrionaceae bacterium]